MKYIFQMHISCERRRVFRVRSVPHVAHIPGFSYSFGIPNHPESSRYALSIAYHRALSSARANFIISGASVYVCIYMYVRPRAYDATCVEVAPAGVESTRVA